jgi:hypothetical protein
MKLTSRAPVALITAVLAASMSPVAAAATSAQPAISAHAQTTPAAWKAVSVPSSVTSPAQLAGVAATSASSAWAVGADALTPAGTGTPLILHWNGTTWSPAALSGVSGPGGLTSVAAASPRDAWAAGTDSSGAVVLHWNGKKWSTVSFPDQATASVLSVAVAPDGTAWLAGGIPNSSGRPQLLVEQWNGKAWHVVNTGLSGGALVAVRVSASGDVFIAGTSSATSTNNLVAYEHGGTWTSLPAAPLDSVADVLGVSGSDVWVAGLFLSTTPGSSPAEVCNWNGSTWSTVSVPSAGQALSISPDDSGQPQWVGTSTNTDPASTLYSYYDGTSWSDVSGAAALTGVFEAYTVTAHIPGTNATWAVGGTADLNSQGNPVPASPVIEYNP